MNNVNGDLRSLQGSLNTARHTRKFPGIVKKQKIPDAIASCGYRYIIRWVYAITPVTIHYDCIPVQYMNKKTNDTELIVASLHFF